MNKCQNFRKASSYIVDKTPTPTSKTSFSSHSQLEQNNLSLCLLPPSFPLFFLLSLPPRNVPEGWSLTSLSKSPSCGESLFLRALLDSCRAHSGPTWLRPPLLPIRGKRGCVCKHFSLTRVKEKTCLGDDSLDKTPLNSQFVALFFNSSLTGRRTALSCIRLYFWLLFFIGFFSGRCFFLCLSIRSRVTCHVIPQE